MRVLGAGRLPIHRHVPGVAAESGDVGLDPLQGGDLVQQSVVARHLVRRLRGQFRMGKPSEHAEPIGDHDDHHSLAGQAGAVVGGVGRRTLAVAATVEEDHHGALVELGGSPRPDVQIQAVLAHRRRAGVEERGEVRADVLHARRREAGGLAGAGPTPHRLGRLPAQNAERRRRIGDRLEDAHRRRRLLIGAHGAGGGLHRVGLVPVERRDFRKATLAASSTAAKGKQKAAVKQGALEAGRGDIQGHGSSVLPARSPQSAPEGDAEASTSRE